MGVGGLVNTITNPTPLAGLGAGDGGGPPWSSGRGPLESRPRKGGAGPGDPPPGPTASGLQAVHPTGGTPPRILAPHALPVRVSQPPPQAPQPLRLGRVGWDWWVTTGGLGAETEFSGSRGPPQGYVGVGERGREGGGGPSLPRLPSPVVESPLSSLTTLGPLSGTPGTLSVRHP